MDTQKERFAKNAIKKQGKNIKKILIKNGYPSTDLLLNIIKRMKIKKAKSNIKRGNFIYG